jgi:hypothetical protein
VSPQSGQMALRIFLAAAKSAVISFLSPALASAVFMAAHPSIFLGLFSRPVRQSRQSRKLGSRANSWVRPLRKLRLLRFERAVFSTTSFVFNTGLAANPTLWPVIRPFSQRTRIRETGNAIETKAAAAWCFTVAALIALYPFCVLRVSFAVRSRSISPTFPTPLEAVHAGLLLVKLLSRLAVVYRAATSGHITLNSRMNARQFNC